MTASTPLDMISSVLEVWSSVAEARAVAYLLHETLARFSNPALGYEVTFATRQLLPLGLLAPPLWPHGAAPEEHVLAIDLLWLIYAGTAGDVPLTMTPEEAQDTVTLVRALFLLLVQFDGRVRQLVFLPNHGGHAPLHTRPASREQGLQFLHTQGPFRTECQAFIEAIVRSSGSDFSPAPRFVDKARQIWLWGMADLGDDVT